ncbi:MAG: hypothetical protein ACKO66_04585 [Flavobacteriales bacterium]
MMKNTMLTFTLILLSFISNSQVVYFEVDTVQNFTHPVGMDVLEANADDVLHIGHRAVSDHPSIKMKVDLNNMEYFVGNKKFEIIRINQTDLLFDITTNEDGFICHMQLAQTSDNQFVYIFEYETDGIMDGFAWVGDEIKVTN